MSTAGEAASLFGAPDTALDPFSTALGGDAPTDDHDGEVQSSNAVSDLFGSATDEFPLDGAGSSSVPQTNVQEKWYDSAGQQSHSYDTASTTGYAPTYQGETFYAQTNGAYSQYGQYGQSNTYSNTVASHASAYESSYAQQSYAPQSYAPPTLTTSAYTQAQQPSVLQNGAYSTSGCDPYKPAQIQPSYAPASHVASTAASSSYDPYKPSSTAAPGMQATYTYGSDSHISAYGNPPVAVPPPPAPVASAPPPPSPAVSVTQFRPKTLNAYDPPLPPIKVKHTYVPPRPTYNTQPPATPPPRNALSPQSLPPPPRRTPEPHTVSMPPRRDSHLAAALPPPQRAPSTGPSIPPMANGMTSHVAHEAPYSPSVSYSGMPTENGPYGRPVRGAGTYAQEGLPKVNDTYAPPPALTSQQTQETDSYGVSGMASQESSTSSDEYRPDYAAQVPDTTIERVVSPARETIPELDEEDLQSVPLESTLFPTSSAMFTTSPSPLGDLLANGDLTWSGETTPSASQVPASPERAKSPPRAVHTAPPFVPNQAPTTAYDPYAPPPKSNVSDRTKSPGASSVRSIPKHTHTYDAPPRRDSVTKSPPISRPLSSQSRRSTFSNLYEPHSIPDSKRTTSPSGSIRSLTAPKQSTYDPYAPVEKPAGATATHTHGRNTSNGSTYSTTSATDPYTPVRHPIRQSSEHAYSSFSLSSQPSSYPTSAPISSSYDRTGGQVLTLPAPTHSTYAPSPSLLGTNDPLGRTSARVPVISFGLGGKLVTCFHGANMNTGFDVALSARQSTDIKIYSLRKIIPESALDTSTASYPGPLFSDPGSPTASIVRTGAQALKTKKARVIKYLEDRVEEINAGLGYHQPGSVDKSRAEAKRILVSLLKVMVENDGRLSGSAQIDSAVRAALVPQDIAPSASDSTHSGSSLIPATSTELLSSYPSLTSALPNTQDLTVSKTVVRSSQLDKIQSLLVKGDRRGACHYAADERLWSHALLIASSIDKECWKDVVTEWIRAELVTDVSQAQGDAKNGREPLRVAYSLFGGNAAAAVQEMVHPSTLLQHNQNSLQIPQPQLTVTPMTPNFPVTQPLNISQEVLASWVTTAAMVLSNPITPESSATLTALGDQLAVHQWIEAAHVCYLLSPQTSPFSSLGTPRLTLLGSPPPATSPTFYKDSDPIIFSEIAEFAMSLAAPAKGQEPFTGFPHLQPYRLIRAVNLAEIGHVQLATRYCEAITACISRSSSSIQVTFIEQLKGLSDRLTAAPQLDKSGSWMGGKMTKPSLDGLGNWLEGRLTKFIAGEGDSPHPEEPKGLAAQQQSYSGPFANYSSISSATNSAYPSPHQSVTDLTAVPSATIPAPPFRAGSAMAGRPPSRSHIHPINRASSAMDYVRPFQRRGSPIARVASANAATFADAASNGQARGPYLNGYAHVQGNSHGDVSGLGHSKPPSAGSWWGASESDATTPTASTFVHLDGQASLSASNSGFISLMDDPMLSMTPTATKQAGSPLPRPTQQVFDDDDDLGFGNSPLRRKPQNGEATAETSAEEEKPRAVEPEKPEVKQTSSGWLSRFWKRSDNSSSSSPAPVKANLGEESSFYYDKELKKWVNKNAAPEPARSAQPPPPPRAQTASPGRSLGAGPPPPSPLGPPPARPATAHAIDLTSEPPRRPPTRVRSNLVPSDVDGSSVPPSPMPPGTPPPPGGGPPRAKGTAAKRNVRSRYVDVFQQEGAA